MAHSTVLNDSVTEALPKAASESLESSHLHAYIELTKLRISVMVLFTFVVAAILAVDGAPNLLQLFFATLGMLLIASSGNAMNMLVERYSDYLMPRTATRPLPTGKLSTSEVATFGAITFGVSVAILLACVNWQTALCGVANWVLYVLIYTPMKRYTWLNTEVGAVAGAMPVVMGCLATSQTVDLVGWAFFGVLLLWQFPHFMAIAWKYRDQYKTGGLQMLTVVDPSGLRAGRKSVITAVLLIVVSLIPVLVLPTGWHIVLFAIACLAIGWPYLKASIKFANDRNAVTARKLLLSSLSYLPLYMLALVVACLV